MILPPDEICRRAERQFNAPEPAETSHLVSDPDSLNLAWDALLRLLDRLDPSYRK